MPCFDMCLSTGDVRSDPEQPVHAASSVGTMMTVMVQDKCCHFIHFVIVSFLQPVLQLLAGRRFLRRLAERRDSCDELMVSDLLDVGMPRSLTLTF